MEFDPVKSAQDILMMYARGDMDLHSAEYKLLSIIESHKIPEELKEIYCSMDITVGLTCCRNEEEINKIEVSIKEKILHLLS